MTTPTRVRRRTPVARVVLAPLVGIVVAVPLTAVVATTPASAAPGLWVITATGTGTATAVCPTGTRLFGLGAEVAGGSAYIRELVPNGALTTATATASAQVTTTVRAICRDGVARMVRASATGAHGTAAAACPANTTLYGLGVGIDQEHDAHVTRLVPDLIPPSASVAANADVPVTAYAICGAATPSIRLADATATAVGSAKTVTVKCPAGTYVRSPGAQVSSDTVVLDKVTTNAALTTATVTAHSAAPGRWVMDAYAICTD